MSEIWVITLKGSPATLEQLYLANDRRDCADKCDEDERGTFIASGVARRTPTTLPALFRLHLGRAAQWGGDHVTNRVRSVHPQPKGEDSWLN